MRATKQPPKTSSVHVRDPKEEGTIIDPCTMTLDEFIQARRALEQAVVEMTRPLFGSSHRKALAALDRMDAGYLESEYHRLRRLGDVQDP